jgi:hypothetical protein
MPEVYEDRYGRHYMVTSGGNPVAVSVDPQGRAYFIDKAGDLFYDTGNRKVGFYVVRAHARRDPGQAPLRGLMLEPGAACPRPAGLRALALVAVTDLRRAPCPRLAARKAGRMRRPAASAPAARGAWPCM